MSTTPIVDQAELTVLDETNEMLDALTVRRVFGAPYTADGVTIIPVAQIGGGGGEGPSHGHGLGMGVGIGARPIGVYEISDGQLKWKPAVDADRLARGGQVLAGIVTVCCLLLLLLRRTN